MTLATDIQKVAAYKTQVEVISGYNEIKDLVISNGTKTNLGNLLLKIVSAPSMILDLAQQLFLVTGTVHTVSQLGLGFGAGKLIDTNDNASALKTAAVGIAADVASAAVTAGSMIAVVKHSKLQKIIAEAKVKESEVLSMISEFRMLSAEDKKRLLRDLGFTEESKIEDFQKTLQSAAKSIATTALIYLAVNGTFSIASGYHGYKRSGALSALGFFLLGSTGLGLGLAQGYAKPIK